jgi:hypothetical protein
MRTVRAWQWGVAALILAGLGWQVATHAPPEWNAPAAPSVPALAIAFALCTVAYVAFANAWARLCGRGESWLDVGGVWFASLVARYAPGGIWQGAVRATGDRRGGDRVRDALLRYVAEQALLCCTAAVLAIVLLAFRPLPVPGLAAGLAALAAAAVLAPRWLSRFGAPWPWPATAVAWAFGAHALMALGFAAFATAWTPAEAVDILRDARGFLIAALAGMLAVFVPAGLGVREGVLAWLLAPQLGVAAGVAVALAARVFLLGCELAAWGSWAVARWLSRRS